MMTFVRTTCVLSLACAALTAQTFPAPVFRTAEYLRDFGDGDAGGGVSLEANLNRWARSSGGTRIGTGYAATGEARAWVSLLGREYNAFRARAGCNYDDVSEAQNNWVTVDAGIFHVFDQRRTATITANVSNYAMLLVPPTGFMVGPVPVTVSVNAGVSYGLNGSFGGTSFVGLQGEGRAFANGSMSAGVGIPGFSAGVLGILMFGDTRPELSVGVSPTTAAGTVSVSCSPVSLYCFLYAEAFWQRFTMLLFSRTWNPISVSRTLL
jgi:hypothetical protein